ncbi:MAG: hypothetical protein ACE5LB_01675, partial [Acidiferrobacterales bacterium]
KLEQDAIAAMSKRGLKTVPVPADALAEWETLTKSLYPQIRGKLVPAEYFDEVLRLRNEFRTAKSGAAKTL